MTLPNRVIEVLKNADAPLTQVDIATRLDANYASIRRTCQELQKAKAIRIYNYTVEHCSPTFMLPNQRVSLTGHFTREIQG